MTARPDSDDYRQLLLSELPLLDVRAPIEFQQGAFPRAVNMPLLNDPEREAVGICYKEQGQDAAITLGHQLVRDDIKAKRVAAWRRFAEQHPEGYLYCFRGGMRSAISQQWLAEAGIDYPRIKGGYKAMRQFLLSALEELPTRLPMIVLGGRTGSAKTHLLNRFPASIDLEGLANHRGSGFGRRATPQPNPIDFENALAIALLRFEDRYQAPLLLEDESRTVGSRSVPLALFTALKAAPLVVLEVSFEERVSTILNDYILDNLADFRRLDAEQGFAEFAKHLRASLERIQRRLGGQRYQQLRNQMDDALATQASRDDASGHRLWIAALLADYYDPMYDYQLANNRQRVVFRGDREAVMRYLCQQGLEAMID